MEKIKLFKKRTLGEVIGTAFELLRQNFRLISMAFLFIVMPLMLLAIIIGAIGLVGFTVRSSGLHKYYDTYFILFLVSYIGYIITIYFQSAVLHEVVIAYEHSEHPAQLRVKDIWAYVKNDLGRIVGSFFGMFPLWIVMGIISALMYAVFASFSSSAGGLWIFIAYLINIYISVCMSNYLMLRLRSQYSVITSVTKSITLTFGKWRWWRTLGVAFIMMLIAFSFYSVSLIPFSIVAYMFRTHLVSQLRYDQIQNISFIIMGIAVIYSGVILSYCLNLMLLGTTVNYYSLVEEKEHLGLQFDIAQLGLNLSNHKAKEGEY